MIAESRKREAGIGARRLLEVNNLKKHFPIERGFLRRVVGHVKAVDGVSLYIKEGEALGLVGESGCGKTTFGRCVVRGLDPTSGEILFRPDDDMTVDLAKLEKSELAKVRRHIHMIFQDPYSSLDPRMTVLDIIGEPIRSNRIADGRALEDRVKELVEVVGLKVEHLVRYPHAFSGGQRQRIGIARSLAANPKLIVCDEAVSALDVSVQAQILNLLQELQEQFALTYLFVAHDLSVVQHVSDRVAVMYVGKIAEMAETDELYGNPKHPYTEALLSAVPTADPEAKMERVILGGEVANPADPPGGCYFHPRCKYAKDICKDVEPPWEEVEPEHFAACHFAKELDLQGVG
jgi:peptide/nickel transport system ATP-binding protein